VKLTRFPTMALLALLTASGCSMVAPGEPVLAFCDAAEPRRFSQVEIDWRSANAPSNLRRDFKDNTTGTRECGWFADR